MADQWGELKRLFREASGRPPSEWPQLLAAVAARDKAIADQLEKLLRAHAASESFLESSPFDVRALPDADVPRGPRLQRGSRLGPYEILALLGAGGMGEVYRARDPRLKRDVAIKILPEDCAGDTLRHRRMEQEAKAVGMLSHPNTLTVYDVGVYEGSPFLVTEVLEGRTLRAVLEAARAEGTAGISVAAAWRIVREIAEGLGAAHSRGIVHRDLKPENVFVTQEGRIKILDFGIAKLTLADTQTGMNTRAGTVLGTVGYMSPEQIRGEPAGPPADVFSAGTIFYELLTGQRAFEGLNAARISRAILTGQPTPLSWLCPSAPEAVGAIIDRCLAKAPEARYPSGTELAAALAWRRQGGPRAGA